MYSPSNDAPITHLKDHFDADIPWHRYWDARSSDSLFRTNDNNGYHSVPLRNWAIDSSNLVLPTFEWKRNATTTANAKVYCKNLVIKVR